MAGENFLTPAAAKAELERFYTTPPHPIAYGSPYAIYLHFKKVLPLKDIVKFVHNKSVYQKHRENRHRAKIFVPMKAYIKRQLLQMDLIDVSSVSKYNDGVNFLLIVEDTLTRYCWLRKLKNKSAQEVLKAFISIHEEIKAGGDDKVLSICADRGKYDDCHGTARCRN